MRNLKIVILGLLLSSCGISLANNNCVREGDLMYITDPEQAQLNFMAHRISNIYVLHKCEKGATGPCDVYQRGDYNRLCQIEKNNSRIQEGIFGAFKAVATGGASAAELAINTAITQINMKPECPATQIIKRLTHGESYQDELVAYYNISRILKIPGTDIDIDDPNLDRDAALLKARNFASRNIASDFLNGRSGYYMRNFKPFIQANFHTVPGADPNNYCAVFYNPNRRSVASE